MPNETRTRVDRRRPKAAAPVEDQLSLFDDDDSFDQPLDPRVVDPGGTPLPPVRHTAPQPAKVVAVGEPSPPPPPSPPALSVVPPTETSAAAAEESPTADALGARPALTVVEGDAMLDSAALPAATDFVLDTAVRVPSGAKSRIDANIAVIDLLRRLQADGRHATHAEQEVLARWSGWGAVPDLFDVRRDTFSSEREYLKSVLTPTEYRAAEASILNAHYTDPAIAAAMWKAVQDAGFTGGRVLEPGCGAGTFMGLAPPSAQMVGVENDPITAAVAAHLYPSAQVRLEGFQSTRVPNNSFAAAVGNVPFGKFVVADPAHNPSGFSIHNAFLLKAVNLTAPGGYVVALTSHFTMDAVTPRARQAIAARAELLGAVRLPTNAFQRVAGTSVVTDVLVLRRRDPGEDIDPATLEWVRSAEMAVPSTDGMVDIPINNYFQTHPDNIIGVAHAGHGQYGNDTLTITSDSDVAAALSERLSIIVNEARARGKALTATPETLVDVTEISFDAGLLTQSNDGEIPLFSLRFDTDTQSFQSWTGSGWEQVTIFKTRKAETLELLALRDAAEAVTRSQRTAAAGPQREHLRAHLNRLYDAYVAKHGPVNRFKLTEPKPRTQAEHDAAVARAHKAWCAANNADESDIPAELAAEWDSAAWEPAAPQKRRTHVASALRADPGWATLQALEGVDPDTGLPTKAPIFSVDLLADPVTITHAENIHDALAVCLDQHHRVDVAHIAALLAAPEDSVREQLRGLVYPSLSNPEQLIPAATALSGNVRRKLAQARAAADTNPIYADYLHALREVMPVDKMSSQIKAHLGAPWIKAEFIEQFAREVLEARRITIAHHNGKWAVDCPGWTRTTVAMTETWGTGHRDAIDLLDAALNSQTIVVNRPARDIELRGGPAIDRAATVAAQAKCGKLMDRFSTWVWEDEARSEELVTEFNTRFNSLRAPIYDGSQLSLPGLSTRFAPHYYQRNAVARIIAEPTVLLDHVVGAGKSGTMFMGAMELKRLGLVKQPWIVVPNHLIEQVTKEAKWWYPTSKILMGATGADAEERRRLAAQSASSEWDMVIVPQSVFERINVHPQIRIDYEQRELSALEEQLRTAENPLTKKMIEAALKRQANKLAKLQKAEDKDTGVTFEQTGCDYLFVDEAHHYKNKTRVSQIRELGCPSGSNKATDLDLKLMVLRARRRDEAAAAGTPPAEVVERVATFATGTPVANSLGELYVMQSYLRPDLLTDSGTADINDWGHTFTAQISTVEANATGTGLHPVTRVGKFTNLQELLSLSSVFTDVVTRNQVASGRTGLTLPELAGGRRTIITITPSQEVKDFITDLAHRAASIDPKRMDLDNILKISNDGRNVSLDPRLANLAKPETSRAKTVADEIMRIHRQTADNVYLSPDTKAPMERTGGLQIVFCDRGTPKEGQSFSMYSAIRDELVEQGLDPAAIRFIHDARTADERLQLFDQCNRGEVSVLIGSTEKMGTGTNVQTRAVALHHVDVPWRPADLEQREGRAIRQGNQNAEVEILNYVTEGSFDTFMWQKVEAKAMFIEQIKRNEVDATEVDDIGGEFTASAAETKAASTGDPRYIQQVKLTDEVARLDALERSHFDAIARRERLVKDTTRQIARGQEAIDQLTPLVGQIAERATGPLAATIGDHDFTDRKDAALPFAHACQRAWEQLRDRPHWETRPVATINGLSLVARRENVAGTVNLSFETPSAEIAISTTDLIAACHPTLGGADTKARGLLTRAENLYKDIPAHHKRLTAHQAVITDELADLTGSAAEPFEHRDELGEKRALLEELTAVLRLESESDAAKAAAADVAERMRAAGRQPGWSLSLNPTPALCEEAGYDSPEAYRYAYILATRHRAKAYREECRDRDNTTDRDTTDLDVDRDDGRGGLAL